MPGLKFRVLLDSEDKTEVFRDIRIKDTENFEVFYKTIIKSFNFQGDQMASFYVSNDDWDKGHEISLMDMSYGDDSIDAVPSVMKDATIKDFIAEPDQKFILVYDFMKMWIFLIELIGYEKEGPETPDVALSVGMAPPEDAKADVDMSGSAFGQDDFGHEGLDEEDDEFGFNDYDDGYEDEFGGSYDDYDY